MPEEGPRATQQAAAEQPVHPDFDKCRNCGAEAKQYVYWNPTGGWACLACGEFDYPEAAE